MSPHTLLGVRVLQLSFNSHDNERCKCHTPMNAGQLLELCFCWVGGHDGAAVIFRSNPQGASRGPTRRMGTGSLVARHGVPHSNPGNQEHDTLCGFVHSSVKPFRPPPHELSVVLAVFGDF